MKLKYILIVVVVLVAGGLLAVNSGSDSGSGEPLGGDTPTVGATIFPLYDLTQQIAGEQFDVVLMLPPGASPHTFDPKPSLVRDLQDAQAVFAIGHNLDTWAQGIADSLSVPIVVVDHDIDVRDTVVTDDHDDDHDDEHKDHDDHDDEHGHEDDHDHDDDRHDHDHGPTDPHYWLSLQNAQHIVTTIADELSDLDPDHQNLYMQRAQDYQQQLTDLEAQLSQSFQGIQNTNVITFHDAWYYFADDFGLDIVGTFEPAAGTDPTPQYLANLEQQVVEHNVTALFLEPQLSSSAITAFARDNDVKLATLDPLGGIDERDSYLNLMRYNVQQVAQALGAN